MGGASIAYYAILTFTGLSVSGVAVDTNAAVTSGSVVAISILVADSCTVRTFVNVYMGSGQGNCQASSQGRGQCSGQGSGSIRVITVKDRSIVKLREWSMEYSSSGSTLSTSGHCRSK